MRWRSRAAEAAVRSAAQPAERGVKNGSQLGGLAGRAHLGWHGEPLAQPRPVVEVLDLDGDPLVMADAAVDAGEKRTSDVVARRRRVAAVDEGVEDQVRHERRHDVDLGGVDVDAPAGLGHGSQRREGDDGGVVAGHVVGLRAVAVVVGVGQTHETRNVRPVGDIARRGPVRP